MKPLSDLLELSKSIATQAGLRLLDHFGEEHKEFRHSPELPKEIKAVADAVLEREILQVLTPLGLPILSEESGHILADAISDYWIIVDPLDGTFNFVKGLGPSAVSIAVWKGLQPVFGVIYSLSDRRLVWGGPGLGSFDHDRRISVSDTSIAGRASICTGLPVRFDLADEQAMGRFCRNISCFGKVRMLGSAAVSLVQVARGSADAYWEKNIMLWDIAAGLAIVEGAGGRAHWVPGAFENSFDVYASNGIISRPE